MAKCNMTTKVGWFVVGAGLGAIAAVLFAPKSGEQTRKLIARKAREGKDYVAEKGKEFKGQAEELVEKGKEVVSKQRDRLAQALEAGKEAAKSSLSR